MTYTVTITSQGQISIPAKFRHELGLDKSKQALVSMEDEKIIIEPIKDFLELEGAFKTKIKISSKMARQKFEEYLGGIDK